MKSVAICLLCLFAFVSSPALPQAWQDRDGKSVPESGSRKSVGGFSSMLIVTPDKDWQEKWNTPSDVTPQFSEADKVAVGDELTILVFFANPKLDGDGFADVSCDFDVTRPDGSSSVHLENAECYRGPISGDPMNVYLSNVSLRVLAEKGDLPGTWVVRIEVKDNLRKVSIPLESSFTIVP